MHIHDYSIKEQQLNYVSIRCMLMLSSLVQCDCSELHAHMIRGLQAVLKFVVLQ
jgi:hypothetical protein